MEYYVDALYVGLQTYGPSVYEEEINLFRSLTISMHLSLCTGIPQQCTPSQNCISDSHNSYMHWCIYHFNINTIEGRTSGKHTTPNAYILSCPLKPSVSTAKVYKFWLWSTCIYNLIIEKELACSAIDLELLKQETFSFTIFCELLIITSHTNINISPNELKSEM